MIGRIENTAMAYTVAATVLSLTLCWTLRFFAPGAKISFLSVLRAVGAASAFTAGAAYLRELFQQRASLRFR
jgi:hypothetical protein